MVRFTAQYRAEGRIDEIRSVFMSGLIFEIALGLILSILSFLLSDFLAISVFNRPTIAPLIKLASFSVFASGLISAGTAAFTGYEKMELNSIMLICQSTIKTAVIITLVLFGLGPTGATIGFTIGTFAAGFIGVLLIWTIYRKLPKPVTLKLEIRAYISAMLQYGLPLSLSSILGGFQTQFYAFLLPIYYATENSMIGNYGIAMNFVVLIGFFATPVTTMLFPAFSKLDVKRDQGTLRNVFQFSVRYASLLVVPVSALVMCLAEPAVSTLFGSTYDSAPLFLALLAITYLYTSFGNLSMGSLISGQGQTQYILKLALLTSAIGFPMGYAMIMRFGVLGLIATTLVAGLPSLIIGLRFIGKNYGVSVDWTSSAKILLSSAIAAALTYATVSQLPFASWVRLVVGAVIFILVFVVAALFTRAINQSDIENLTGMISNLGLVGRILTTLLNLMGKLIAVLKL
jgi:O-antigen/teichoic acid export membrane protein